jgi:transposase
VLLGIAGVTVDDAAEGPGGRLEVWARVSCPVPCPKCGTFSGEVHGYVTTHPRDVRYGSREIRLYLGKRRLACGNGECPRGTFTEWVPQLPPRCKITRRLRDHCGDEVAERGITPAEAARHNGVSWPSAHGAFAEKADKLLGEELAPVAHLGIDEHRRGRARWRTNEETGEYVLVADRWHTCFYDLSGGQGMLGQVEGRTADDAAYWLAGATPAWRDAIRVVSIDMGTIYQSAVKRMLPRAKIAVDLFHVVQLAVKTTGDVRRRAIRELYGRRGKAGDPEYGIKHLLGKNLENLSPDQFGKVIETLDATGAGHAEPRRPGVLLHGPVPAVLRDRRAAVLAGQERREIRAAQDRQHPARRLGADHTARIGWHANPPSPRDREPAGRTAPGHDRPAGHAGTGGHRPTPVVCAKYVPKSGAGGTMPATARRCRRCRRPRGCYLPGAPCQGAGRRRRARGRVPVPHRPPGGR